MKKNGKTWDGYIRVSQVGDREGESFISPGVQERELRAWCARTGIPIIVREPELNQSGRTTDRPIFNDCLERIRTGQSGGIVVYKFDRFARTTFGALKVLTEIGQHNGGFASATEAELDYSTPSGKAFLHMLFVFAEFVSDTTGEHWRATIKSAIGRGRFIANTVALGYDKLDGRLVPNELAPLVLELFERRATGASIGELASWLESLNVPAPGRGDTGSSDWTNYKLQRLFRKRTYLGEVARGEYINETAHEAIVPRDLWDRCQPGKRPSPLPFTNGGPLLSQIVRCAGCRNSLSPMGQSRNGGGFRTYGCRGRHAAGRCEAPASISKGRLEEYVEQIVRDNLANRAESYSLTPDDSELEAVEAELTQARADLDAFKRDTTARRRLGDVWSEWLDEYLSNVERLEHRRAELIADRDSLSGLTVEHYESLPTTERREVIAQILDCVFVRKPAGRYTEPVSARTFICGRGEAPDGLPRRGGTTPPALTPFEWD